MLSTIHRNYDDITEKNPVYALKKEYTSPVASNVHLTTWTLEHGDERMGGRVKRRLYPRARLNKKDGLTRYGNSHVKDKTS